MRSHLQSFRSVASQATAALAALAVGVAAASADPILPVGGPQPSPEANPPGRVMAQADGRPDASASTPLTPATPDMKAVQDLLGRAVDDVTTPGRSADLITLLARHDRDRFGAPGDWADVDRAADGFRDTWQARFGLTFKLWDKIPLVITEPAVHVTGLEPTVGGSTTQPSPPARRT